MIFIKDKFTDIITLDANGNEIVIATTFEDGSMITYPISLVENAVNNSETQTGEWLRLVTMWHEQGRC